MATYSTNEFRGGLKLLLDGDPCTIIENEFVKPGKGQAFNRVKIRNLKTGRVLEKTFRSGETVEAADVVDRNLQYLYNDGEFWHFMDDETFELFAALSFFAFAILDLLWRLGHRKSGSEAGTG